MAVQSTIPTTKTVLLNRSFLAFNTFIVHRIPMALSQSEGSRRIPRRITLFSYSLYLDKYESPLVEFDGLLHSLHAVLK